MKCIGEVDTFSNTGTQRVSFVPLDLNMDTISGTTHIKMIIIHILHFFMIIIVFFINLQAKKSIGVKSGE
jgi:hypothetical protein